MIDKVIKYAGGEWLQGASSSELYSSFALKVADIVGQVFRGLYHLPYPDRHEWLEKSVKIFYTSELATYDGKELTTLVLLCHEAAVRLSISTGFYIYKQNISDDEPEFVKFIDDQWYEPEEYEYKVPCITLSFHPRVHDSDRLFERHPTVQEAIETTNLLWKALEK